MSGTLLDRVTWLVVEPRGLVVLSTPGPQSSNTSGLCLPHSTKIPGLSISAKLRIQKHKSGTYEETGAPTPSVLMFCPDYTSNMTPREGVGDVESKEDREERY